MTLNFQAFSELPSTSEKVHELLSDGLTPPLAVFATRQTAGRGRRGKSWDSPAGNIYLSMALPANELSLQQIGWLPLQMAAIVAYWIEHRFKVHVTIKWPNDLLLEGRKLCGILCESAVQGSELSHVIVGCGLNIQQAPNLAAGDQLTSCLSEHVAIDATVEELARDLAQEILQCWQGWDRQETLVCFDRYSFKESQPYSDTTECPQLSVLLCDRIDHQGRLLLRKPAGTLLPPISSVHHQFRWFYLGKNPLVVADLGNTRVKVYLFKTPQCSRVQRSWVVANTGEGWQEVLQQLRLELTKLGVSENAAWPLHIAAVGNSVVLESDVWASSFKFLPLQINKRTVHYQGDYNLNDIGLDRLASIEAYLSHRNGKPALLVSCGTAITIDVVSPQGVHLGGWILPGFQMSLDSLAQKTRLLPQINLNNAKTNHHCNEPLQNTVEAMTGGVLTPVLAMIERQIQLLEKKFKGKPTVVLYGGAANHLSEFLATPVDEEHLARGLRLLVLAGG